MIQPIDAYDERDSSDDEHAIKGEKKPVVKRGTPSRCGRLMWAEALPDKERKAPRAAE